MAVDFFLLTNSDFITGDFRRFCKKLKIMEVISCHKCNRPGPATANFQIGQKYSALIGNVVFMHLNTIWVGFPSRIHMESDDGNVGEKKEKMDYSMVYWLEYL